MKRMNICLSLAVLSACSTLSESLTLGGTAGAGIGAYTGALAYSGPKHEARAKNIAISASIGLGVGLLSSYLLHGVVDERVKTEAADLRRTEVYYGDLPPNPFQLQPLKKKGGQ